MSEQVPSWQVTETQLAAWGFPLRRTDKCVGSTVVVAEGMTWREALHAAWAAGFVRIAATPEHVAEARREAFHARLARQRSTAAENLAFLRAHGTIVGPTHNCVPA